jgi:copper homeostasis protein (lipoprotein)
MVSKYYGIGVFIIAAGLILAGCDSSDVSEIDVSQLEDTKWNLVQIGNQSMSDENPNVEPNLTFHSKDRSVSGSGGCNQFHGGYAVDGETLAFGQIASTLMACAEGMDVEQNFLGSLEAVATWRLDQGVLEFFDPDGRLLMRFESVGP